MLTILQKKNRMQRLFGESARNVCSISATFWSNKILFWCNNISSNYTNSSKWYSILAEEIERQTHVSTLYFIIFIKKEINTCLGIKIDVFFITIMMGDYETCLVITPNSFFFKGVITGHQWYSAVLPETNFTFQKFITCSTLLAKQITQY